jgi:hypothetical protein
MRAKTSPSASDRRGSPTQNTTSTATGAMLPAAESGPSNASATTST